jgi:hypothetical protein
LVVSEFHPALHEPARAAEPYPDALGVNRIPVSSTNVSSIGWEPAQDNADIGTLEVCFTSGGVYQYLDVPESVYRDLMGAVSVGRFLRQAIVGAYDHIRVG